MTKRRVRVEIPIRQPDKLIDLAETIYEKNKIDPQLDNVINISLLNSKTIEAKNKRNKAKELYENAKNILHESNTLLGISKGQTKEDENTIYSITLQIRDHLKQVYKSKEENLRLWGFKVEIFEVRGLRKVKLIIPINCADMLIVLFENIYAQSLKQPEMLKDFKMDKFIRTCRLASAKRLDSKKINDEADKLIQESNLILGLGYGQTKETDGTIFNLVNSALKSLLDKFKGSEEKLVDWGYKTIIVNSSFPIKGTGLTTKKISAITCQRPLITVNIIFKGTYNKKIYVTWGDGNADKVNMLGHTTPNSIYHDYQEEGEYEIQITGDISKLSYFEINGNQIKAIDIPKNLKNLANISIKNNIISTNKVINDLLFNLDSAGVFNGELDISGGTNATPASYGNISKNNLISRGWEIFTN